METADWQVVVEGLARGQYNLLLGAGASLGALGGDGNPLPSAPQLASELLQRFDVDPAGERLDLREAYELCCQRAPEPQAVETYLRLRFSGCEPSWQRVLTRFRWRRIWTLNIDDVVEQAYRSAEVVGAGPSAQCPARYSWKSLYREPDRTRDEVQIIHLHGFVSPGVDYSGDLIFSIVEYVQASSRQHTWHRVFGDLFQTEPFIIVGARLSDEFDLAECTRRGNNSVDTFGRPSLIVLREMSDLKKIQYKRFGLGAVVQPAEKFFGSLVSEVKEAEKRIVSLLPGPQRAGLTRQARVFLAQFNWLRLESMPAEVKDHDFYRGDDPLWVDILLERDGRSDLVGAVLHQVITMSATSSQAVHLIHGPRGAGKSTALLRLGRELASRGRDVFLFRGEERLDVEAAEWWLSENHNAVLMFDGLADFAGDLRQLTQRCVQHRVPLLVLAAERESRVNLIYQDIPADILVTGPDYKMAKLSDRDIIALVEKLDSARRLGKLTRRTAQERLEYFVKDCGRQLIVAMIGLEGGGGFENRISEEFVQDIDGEELKDLYAIVCMAFSFGYPLPVAIASAASGITVSEALVATRRTRQLAGLVSVRQHCLVARHRVVASLIVERALSAKKRYSLSHALARSLAPYLTLGTVSGRSIPVRIAKRLMDQEVVSDWVGVANMSEWYEGLRSQYDWTSRYWEQRALAEAKRGRYPQARSFAEHAVSLERHPFTLNTLGTILLRMAMEPSLGASPSRDSLFWEGVSSLEVARELGRGEIPHPYVTFFTYSLKYARSLIAADGRRSDQLLEMWQRWMRKAEAATYFQHPEKLEELRGFQQQWLLLLV